MKNKIQLLFTFFLLPFFLSCTALGPQNNGIRNPPNENFVKIFKELTITKCKKEKKKKLSCKEEKFYSTGSGLIIEVSPTDVVVLTAGHVCDSTQNFVKENKKFLFYWSEKITILNYEKKFYNAGIIIVEQASESTSDLCSLLVPGMAKKTIKKKVFLSRRPPVIGERVYYMGAPLGIYHPPSVLITDGIFSGKINETSSLVSIFAAQGASGSAILSTNNRLYGVLFANHVDFRRATIVTNYEKTKNFIQRTKKMLEIIRLRPGDIE